MGKTYTYRLMGFLLAVAVCLSAFAFIGSGRADGVVFAAAGDGTLTVHFIDCGQADACVIEFPDGKNMLIDAGENKTASYNGIITYIKDNTDIEAFDYFIMTHSDADHIGGVVKVLSEFPANTVYRPNQQAEYTTPTDTKFYTDPAASASGSKALYGDYATKKANTYVNALEKAYSVADNVYVTNPSDDNINNITGNATVNGESFEYTFDFYSPLADAYSDNNNYSPIMVLTYAGRNIVLSGDAEKENEREFVSLVRDSNKNARYDRFRSGSFKADIIKMGHHGSSTSSSEDYLEIMCSVENARRNAYTIFSCGENLSYGHPHEATLQRLMDMKFSAQRIRRTDLQGNVRFNISARGQISEKHNTEAEISDILTCGKSNNQTTHPLVTVKDNGILPSEDNSDIPDPDVPLAPNPFLTFWNGLAPTVRIVIIIAVVIIVILIITLVIVYYRKKGKKKKSGKRSRR